MSKVPGKTYSTDVPGAPPSQVLAECYAAFERSEGLDVSFAVADGRVATELADGDGVRPLRPSELFDLLD